MDIWSLKGEWDDSTWKLIVKTLRKIFDSEFQELVSKYKKLRVVKWPNKEHSWACIDIQKGELIVWLNPEYERFFDKGTVLKSLFRHELLHIYLKEIYGEVVGDEDPRFRFEARKRGIGIWYV